MSVRVRPYRRGGWEVDERIVTPDGTRKRDRRRAPVSSKSAALRWGEPANASCSSAHQPPQQSHERRCQP